MFDEYYMSLHPKENNTRNPWFNEYWEEIFNCSLGGQNNLDRDSCDLENQMQSIESRNFQNYIIIDAVYAFAHALHRMQQDYCPHGKGLCREILESRSQFKQTVIKGELLVQYLHNVSFNGISADRIEFDKNGDQQGGYDIVNLQVDSYGNYQYIKVGSWDINLDHTAPLIFYREIQWIHSMNGSDVPDSVCSQPCGGGEYPQPIVNQAECCWVCKQCGGTNQVSDGIECRECNPGFRPNKDRTNCTYIQPTFLTWSDPLAIVTIILSLIGIATTTFVIVVFVVYHDTHLIKASSRELSFCTTLWNNALLFYAFHLYCQTFSSNMCNPKIWSWVLFLTLLQCSVDEDKSNTSHLQSKILNSPSPSSCESMESAVFHISSGCCPSTNCCSLASC